MRNASTSIVRVRPRDADVAPVPSTLVEDVGQVSVIPSGSSAFSRPSGGAAGALTGNFWPSTVNSATENVLVPLPLLPSLTATDSKRTPDITTSPASSEIVCADVTAAERASAPEAVLVLVDERPSAVSRNGTS